MYKNKISHLTQQDVIDQAPTELKPGKILYDLTVINQFKQGNKNSI